MRFFGFCFLTGALGGRTVDGEMPPVTPTGPRDPADVPGVVPPVGLVGTEVPPDGGATPPVAADAVAVPHPSATQSRTLASTTSPFTVAVPDVVT